MKDSVLRWVWHSYCGSKPELQHHWLRWWSKTNQCTKQCTKQCTHEMLAAIAKKKIAPFFRPTGLHFGSNLGCARANVAILQTGRLSSDWSYFIRVVISINCIHSAIFLWITFSVFWLIWCSTAFGCGALRVFASTTLRTRTCEFHALSCYFGFFLI